MVSGVTILRIDTMGRSKLELQGGPRRAGRYRTYYGPLLWIVVLLAGWFLLTGWQELPHLISSAMASLT
jgi:hypothetical protein